MVPDFERSLGSPDPTSAAEKDERQGRLRRYIEEDPTRPRHLQTVRGVGYKFVQNPA